ncbi:MULTISPECIES: TonB-dependent receptor [Pseudoalteromonas]|uniref:TonB-dependent receptor n=1 Tax=Pseudoalteromonas porphyrae TaxID=187330 RepID=A0A0N0M0B5_9GAMM|nr:TonB-dependent receptor [Pseudoalteromonas porphyrae]KPH63249.1 TonB-dependent receptor [Pseudoalteromonas porphyrae]
MLAKNFKKSLLAVNIGLVMSAGFTGAAFADEAQVKEGVEVIEVRGIRGSLKASINGKRFSDAVVDVVSAEDVGKFPDGDVGESLARIPGVTVSRQFGQGQQVSIRGASSQLTRTLLNGHTVASTGWYDQQAIDRSFNYAMLPSEMVGGLEVYKSSQANLVEGGIGGTVIVKSRKPLDLDSNSVFASVKGAYGTTAEELNPEVSGLYSWKNDSESFGVLVSGAYSATEYQRNGVETSRNWSGGMAPTTFQQDRDRKALNVALQYRPTDQLEFGLNLMSLDLNANNANGQIIMFPGDDSCVKVDPTNDNCIVREANNTGVSYANGNAGTKYAYAYPDFGAGYFQTWAREASMDSKTVDLDWKYEADSFTFSGRVGNTKSEGGARTALVGEYTNNFDGQVGTWDMTGDQAKFDVVNKNYDSSILPSMIGIQTWALGDSPNSDEETYVNLDFDIPVDFGVITAIKTGLRYADHSVKKQGFKGQLADNYNHESTFRAASEYFPGVVSSGAGFTIPEANGELILSDSLAATDHYTEKKDAYGTVEEENFALYAMADFSSDGIRGNLGLRYISTDASSDYYAFNSKGEYGTTLSTDTASYNELLPSVNVVLDLSEDVILRTSAAQVISRPNYSDMFATTSLSNFDSTQPNTQVASTGNVALKPFKAFQADISVEWYFSEDGMVSIGYFMKDVSSFISTRDANNQQIGLEIPIYKSTPESSPCGTEQADCWSVSQSTNVSGGSIEGIELQIQDAFDNGFGYSVNYTYADATSPGENYPDGNNVFSDSSEHTVNTVGFYENDFFSARLAYNWRSEYIMREAPGWYLNRTHKDFGTLDFSATWSATDYLDVTFEAANILKEDSLQTGVYQYGSAPSDDLEGGFPAWSFEGEATYKMGVAVRF